MMARAIRTASATLLVLLSLWMRGQNAYRPQEQVSGTIRSSGSAQMDDLMTLWERGFHRYHPSVSFEDKLNGTVSGMGGLYNRVIDLSLMGREIWPSEALAYEQMMGHSPTGVEVAIGSFDVPTKADALVVFVHRDNPLVSLSLTQLRSIFGCGDASAASAQRWLELGVNGALAEKPIHVYGYKLDNAAAMFFKSVVLKDTEWRCGIRTYANQTGADGKRVDSGQLIINALASDPVGIAISNSHYATANVRAVALAVDNRSSAIMPTRESVAGGEYPLARAVYIFFNRESRKPVDPRVREFLRYVLSPEGQQQVVREGAYLPLPEHIRQAQLRKIP